MEKLYIKEDGKIIFEEYIDSGFDKEYDCKYNKYKKHLCYDGDCCVNSSPLKCEKIADVDIKHIANYPFIMEGLEICDIDGEVKRLKVTSCKNYKKQVASTRKTSARKLKDSLRIAYFETETADEARLKQFEMFEKGKLSRPNGTMISREEADSLKLKLKKINK